jgi:hypothetical protein
MGIKDTPPRVLLGIQAGDRHKKTNQDTQETSNPAMPALI